MRVIFDTNILIDVEDHKELNPTLAELLTLLEEHEHTILVHPASMVDLEKDKNTIRKKIVLSKIKGYPILKSAPTPNLEFLKNIGNSKKLNNVVDNRILYAVYSNSVHFLITQDRGLHKKAMKMGINDRVFDILSAYDYFRNLHFRRCSDHTLLKKEPMSKLDINDPFFDYFKRIYPGFKKWFKERAQEGRECRVYYFNGRIGALMIIKEEDEQINVNPPLPKKKRLKICTLKSAVHGSKLGELFLKIAFKFCLDNHISEVYLTHFPEEEEGEDPLVSLLNGYGFKEIGKKIDNGESVYLKNFDDQENLHSTCPLKSYPFYKEDESKKRFLVPVSPQYHNRLFPDYQKRQQTITEYIHINIVGNAIKKAYLCHSKIKKIKKGDILLFYRSQDQKRITSVGIVENTFRTQNPNTIMAKIGSRTVYSETEIKEMAKKPVLILLFVHNFNLPEPVSLVYLKQENILKGFLQSIREVSYDDYKKVTRKGGLYGFDIIN
ncbi:EVE domain-containing protein [Candidatus Micrarchaeota archaeon]|nr:EVE domain-containing protein [Candidatus Micrarchaeota archaeon]